MEVQWYKQQILVEYFNGYGYIEPYNTTILAITTAVPDTSVSIIRNNEVLDNATALAITL